MLTRFDYKIDFIGKKWIALSVSGLLILTSIVSFIAQGLVFGLDFTGGTLIEIGYSSAVELEPIRAKLHQNGFPDAVVQYFGTTRDVSIRLGVHEEKMQDSLDTPATPTTVGPTQELSVSPLNQTPSAETSSAEQKQVLSVKILNLLRQEGQTVDVQRVEYVGSQVGGELIEKGGLALLLTLIGILIYVAIRFEYRFAVGAVAALVHDVLITVGFFSFFRWEFDLTVLAAILAVIGYSLNDTIVVFDRIRDNLIKLRKQPTVDVVNTSINQTLGRTVMTSVATAIVVLILLILGGDLIRGFSIALLVGIAVGTYSSIYIASVVALALGISKADLMPVEKEGLRSKAEF